MGPRARGGNSSMYRLEDEDVYRCNLPGSVRHLHGQSIPAAAAAAVASGPSRLMELIVRVGVLYFSRHRRLAAAPKGAASVGGRRLGDFERPVRTPVSAFVVLLDGCDRVRLPNVVQTPRALAQIPAAQPAG